MKKLIILFGLILMLCGCDLEEYNKVQEVGDIIYFNPNLNKLCDKKEANSTSLVKEGCMKFYVININEDSFDVILNHNTTAFVNYNNINNVLKNDTTSWDNSLNIRLLKIDDLLSITNIDFNEEEVEFNLNNKYYYLVDNLYNVIKNEDNEKYIYDNDYSYYLFGYWLNDKYSQDNIYAWRISNEGKLCYSRVDSRLSGGVRPVITISKEVLN